MGLGGHAGGSTTDRGRQLRGDRARGCTATVLVSQPERGPPCARCGSRGPASPVPGVRAQPGVRVDGAGVAHQREHRQVVGRVGVRRAAARTRPSRAASALTPRPSPGRAACRRPGGRCRRRPRARRPCPWRVRPSRRAMMRGDLDRRGGDQPDPLALVEVQLGEGQGAGGDPVHHRLLEDLLAELLELECRCGPAMKARAEARVSATCSGSSDADQPEVRLLLRRPSDVAGREEPPAVEPPGQVEDARALHHACCRRRRTRPLRVGGRRQGVLDLGGRRGRLTGHRRTALEVERGERSCGPDRLRGSGAATNPLWNHRPMSLDTIDGRRRGRSARPGRRPGGSAAAQRRRRDALVEPSGRRLTWADLDREADRVAAGLGDVGMVAGQRVMMVIGNRLELVTTYLGALRAQLVAVPVNPRAKVEELAWMIADSGARLVVADSAAVAEARAAAVLVREALAGSRGRPRRRGGRPGPRAPRWSSWTTTARPPTSSRSPPCAPRAAARPDPPGPGDARLPPLHRQHRRPAARRDAHPPRAAGQHRAGRSRPPRRWSTPATWCSGCCRSSTSTA